MVSQLRRRLDGTTGYLSPAANGTWTSALGWTGRDDGKIVDLARCGEVEIRFAGIAGHRLALDSSEARFPSGDAQFAGRLVLPVGRDAVPIVVLMHGSEDSSALRFFALQRMLPAQGVGVFDYDKRGTGRRAGCFNRPTSRTRARSNVLNARIHSPDETTTNGVLRLLPPQESAALHACFCRAQEACQNDV